MARNIATQFPIVSRADLSYGDRCAICDEAYSTKVPSSAIVNEHAVRLPCGHEFGSECISRWLSPEDGKNTCPLCRQQLFPRASEPEEGTPAVWEALITAVELDIELTSHGIVHRSRRFRDWLLYEQLHGQGANLPPWRPNTVGPGPGLDSSEEDALFAELQRRGAFRALPVDVAPLASERQMWDSLRNQGYSYDPIYAATANGCAWSRS